MRIISIFTSPINALLIVIRTSLLALFLVALIGTNCSHPICCSPGPNTGISVTVVDKQGNNLLNPSVAGYYKEDEIKLFLVVDGANHAIANTLGRTYFAVTKDKDPHLVLANFYGDVSGRITGYRALLQWREHDVDTIDSVIEYDGNMPVCSNVKWNGVVKFDKSTSTVGAVFEIVK